MIPKDALISGPTEYAGYMQKGIKVAAGGKVENQMILILGWAQCSHDRP